MVEAGRRVRDHWARQCTTEGQQRVLMMLVLFTGKMSIAEPTAVQLAQCLGMHPGSVRRILQQLETLGAVTRVGTRPVYTSSGTAHGSKVPQWSISPAPVGATDTGPHPRTGVELAPSHPRTPAESLALTSHPNSTPRARHWEVGKLGSTHICEFDGRGPGARFLVCRICNLSTSAKKRMIESDITEPRQLEAATS